MKFDHELAILEEVNRKLAALKLTDAEKLKLEAIRRNRERKMLPTLEEIDFLLELLARVWPWP